MSAAVSRVKRTQVYLDPVEHEALKRKAAEEGVSMSELVRRIVREQLGLGKHRGSPEERLMRLVAIGASGLSDVSERHDEYLARALRRETERRE
ncbi:MAG: CopG family transcriptional regulator [Bacillota bacterium]